MSRPLRIAAHNGARTYGGGEKWTVLLLRGLQERGHSVHLYCNSPGVVQRARAEGVDASVAVLGGHLMLPQAWSFSRRLRAFKADALLVATFKKVWLAGRAARRAGVRTVVSRIGLDTDLPGKHWSYRMAFRRWVDATLVNADGIRRAVVAGLPDCDPARVATVYDGIVLDAAVPPARDAKAALGLPVDAPVVGAIARLSAQKRLDRLVTAVSRLPGVHLALAGEGELDPDLRALAVRLGLEDRVHFLGFRTDIARVLSALDVFAITSDREGMANAMLEAMAAGVPVVSTPVSGADEALFTDGEGRSPGLIVEADPIRLAEAMKGLLDAPALRLAMGEEGRRRVREGFSYEGMLDAWQAVLGGDAPANWHQGA
ncbi:MAG TPA: glycosyltransferase [Longimicrobiales bacterium]|nr:glycosyltransferase [Longimicrobiales bacterium]